jgi:glycosyltransferase involved in cell wall biosynthesis
MKKILIIHNTYRVTGGEDIAVENEIELLKKSYEVKVIKFDNSIRNYIFQTLWFILNKNLESVNLVKNELSIFNPDYVYIHNTWFKVSLGIFKLLEDEKIKTILKIHNFRYFCTKSFLTKNHIFRDGYCEACGLDSKSLGFFNKYFTNSMLRSFLINFYGKKYYKILKNNKIKILVLTDFHKKFMEDLGFSKNKVTVFRNFISSNPNLSSTGQTPNKFFVYAGRISSEKGLQELINSFCKVAPKDFQLKIIGTGPMLNLLKKQSITNVEFLGSISNQEVINQIANSKGVVTATKLLEGQPTLLCEASSLGIPSIFPRTGGLTEFFPDDYEFSFKQHDYNDLEQKLKSLIELDNTHSPGNESKLFIDKLLDENLLTSNFESILNEL